MTPVAFPAESSIYSKKFLKIQSCSNVVFCTFFSLCMLSLFNVGWIQSVFLWADALFCGAQARFFMCTSWPFFIITAVPLCCKSSLITINDSFLHRKKKTSKVLGVRVYHVSCSSTCKGQASIFSQFFPLFLLWKPFPFVWHDKIYSRCLSELISGKSKKASMISVSLT